MFDSLNLAQLCSMDFKRSGFLPGRSSFTLSLHLLKTCTTAIACIWTILCAIFCSKRDIMQQNYEMHEVHCHRKLKLCEKCEEPIPISEMVEHMNEYHALVECKCKMRVEKSLLQKHEVFHVIIISRRKTLK